ncbi:purine-nucleoside phosphorylase [Botrimarina hoheduenensis]|uniref:Purine nucleoside phosphorylase n=1 Tax=Botrimarina hoheduenensis TaxID=2528000 RepID=A0A5C5WFP1_9BACT|nr:purine-nucleoside phosphorylase [Botrimarina hoheduenensis]TWT48909.1 Purine nucleoside phosphorylase 1 [Botrimarina hoheduenensis]
MKHLFGAVEEAAAAIRTAINSVTPRVGIILGSGLGDLAHEIHQPIALPYADLPHFPRSTAAGHAGRLMVGKLGDTGQSVVALQGRFHLYEGWNAQQAAFPVWVLNQLGVNTLLVSNAAGGLNPRYQVGDVMLIDDHINFMFQNPLRGVNDDRLGPRFPDMSAPYDQPLMELAEAVARREGFFCPRGVYVGMLGPTYETRAEYRMARRLGGDAAGMSTVPEVVAAAHCGMRVLGLSTITNACSPDQLGETTHEEVIAAAASAGKKLQAIVEAVVLASS